MKPITDTRPGALTDITVVRDDLFPGGTKARFIPLLFKQADHLVYASPAEGGAQTALAHVAARLGKRVTIVVAARAKLHPRTLEARRLGANILAVRPGYLAVVRARAREFAAREGARLLPFGLDVPEAGQVIAEAALSLKLQPSEVWCAAGSGVLARALAAAWPAAQLKVVAVGRAITAAQAHAAEAFEAGIPFSRAVTCGAFPSCPHYDAKAWMFAARKAQGNALFWNVAGPAKP